MNKDNLLLEQAYESIYKNPKRIPYSDDLNEYGDYVSETKTLENLPPDEFPNEVVEKYMDAYGMSLEEVQNYGLSLDPVPFAIRVDWLRDDGEPVAENVILEAFQMKDERDEDIFTVQDTNEQYKIDLLIENKLQELIDRISDDLVEEMKEHNRDNY